MDESTFVAQAAAGDVAAFNLLARAHQSKVRGLLLRLTKGDHALADDLGQETFLEAWRSLKGFRGDSAFATWLYRIAYSRFLMQARKRRLEPLEDDWQGESPSGAAATHARIDLERAFARLSAPESAALTLCYALGLSNTQAAEALDMPLGTLKSHVLRGREKLKALLGSEP